METGVSHNDPPLKIQGVSSMPEPSIGHVSQKQLELQYIHLEVKPALQQVVNQFDNNFKKYKN